MDSLVYDDSINTEISGSQFVDKQFLYVSDSNNGSYSSQIILDSTPLSNSGGYISWAESFLLIPLVFQIESPAAILSLNADFDFLGALKSGYWNIIHSMNVEFNNSSVVQLTPLLNAFTSFKCITGWSQNDLVDWGAVCGFRPDTSTSWCYLDTAPAAGIAAGVNVIQTGGTGLSNNRNSPYIDISGLPAAGPLIFYNQRTRGTLSSTDVRAIWNEGLFQRQLDINYDATTTAALSGFAANQFSSNKGALMSVVDCRTVFRTFINKAANIRWCAIDAVIRMKDICDLFGKMPLTRGATFRLYINTNQVFYTLGASGPQFAAATGVQNSYGAVGLTSAPVILGGGATNPTMISSMDLGQGLSRLVPLNSDAGAASTAAIQVGLSVVRTQFSQLTTQNLAATITACRLYAPVYTMSVFAAQRYLSLMPTKKVVYNDIFQFSFPNQTGQFNFLVTNGIPNIRSVLLMPFLPRASNGVSAAAYPAAAGNTTSNTLLSPFCSTPSSPDPIMISNYQVQISGKNLFNQNIQYDFELFQEQLVSSNQLNGSLTTSLSSGLVSKRDFQNLYRYYYANAGRSITNEENVAKSIQLSGEIKTGVVVDLICFVEYERQLTLDLTTGQRIA